MIRRFATVLFVVLVPLTAHSAGSYWQIDVNTDMTAAGRAGPQPSPGNPVYYLPRVGGYQQLGSTVSGEIPPPQKEVIHKLAKVLAQAGYLSTQLKLLAPEKTGSAPPQMGFVPPPTIILMIYWGYLNPVKVDNPVSDPTTDDTANPAGDSSSIVLNDKQMTTLVAGIGVQHLDLGPGTDDVMHGISTNRYFVVVEAYDMQAYMEQHKKVLLWSTKISMPSDGVTLPQVMPTLIASGGPLLGRETVRPKWIEMPAVPDGQVEVGMPEVKGYIDAPPAPVPQSPSTPNRAP
jgi:hypothetical protein